MGSVRDSSTLITCDAMPDEQWFADEGYGNPQPAAAPEAAEPQGTAAPASAATGPEIIATQAAAAALALPPTPQQELWAGPQLLSPPSAAAAAAAAAPAAPAPPPAATSTTIAPPSAGQPGQHLQRLEELREGEGQDPLAVWGALYLQQALDQQAQASLPGSDSERGTTPSGTERSQEEGSSGAEGQSRSSSPVQSSRKRKIRSEDDGSGSQAEEGIAPRSRRTQQEGAAAEAPAAVQASGAAPGVEGGPSSAAEPDGGPTAAAAMEAADAAAPTQAVPGPNVDPIRPEVLQLLGLLSWLGGPGPLPLPPMPVPPDGAEP